MSCWRHSNSPRTADSGSGTSVVLEQRREHLVPGLAALLEDFTRSSRLRRSARNSSSVSNSLAVWANSSSSSGSSFSLTERTVTVMSAVLAGEIARRPARW